MSGCCCQFTCQQQKSEDSRGFFNEHPRNLISFFILGLVNNFAYVVFLSAAGDILNGALPPAVVLLAEMIPIIAAQGVAPLFIERIPFRFRVVVITIMASGAFALVGFTDLIETKILGIVIGSISSGFGEITFMALSSFYNSDTVSAYSSGTGGAGIFGSLAYLALNTWAHLSPSLTLKILIPFPILMAIAYLFILLPSDAMKRGWICGAQVKEDEHSLMTQDQPRRTVPMKERLRQQIRLFQYTGPLFLVYFGEYVISYGIAPVLLFPGDSTFNGSEYKYYSFVYQVGVFISRSSANFVRIRWLWLLAGLQIANMIFLGTVAYWNYIPNIWIVFAIILYEGLIGGAIFVNTFYRVAEEVEGDLKEFCMSSISFWYSCGILLAGIIGYQITPWLAGRRPHAPAPAPAPSPSSGPSVMPSPASGPSSMPTSGPSFMPSPTPGPSVMPSPASGPSLMPSPVPIPSLMPSPASAPSMMPSPTPTPSFVPSPTASPLPAPIPRK
eukprot:TRINITY_DN2720_c0_g1_i1.p1 TRINITY_DN2720_c0_g1~~TRINITY_DN2720_c0_g1_i1.p1  ORF type:complete len:508 (+),score=63.32 TRINITY_DN2720_c0_g1_i1:26-1525(+)